MGGCQTEQPLLGEVAIRPTLLIRATTSTAPSSSSAQDTAQAHPDPAVKIAKHRGVAAVLEVLEPTSQGAVDILHDPPQAIARCALGLRAERGLELPAALVTRPVLGA